jgi:Arc/MetJ family transcription regulator
MAVRRISIELDEELLSRARPLGQNTTRSTVEEALRRAVEDAESAHATGRDRRAAI